MLYTDQPQRGDIEPIVLDIDQYNPLGVFNSRNPSFGFGVRHVWFPNGQERAQPTKKGITIPNVGDVEVFIEELVKAVNELEVFPYDLVLETQERE